jgi:uncharacterized protein (DUF1697 family)
MTRTEPFSLFGKCREKAFTMTSIALLRGINVGGKKAVRMADLVALMHSLHAANVRSYLQSGNVVFDHDRAAPAELSRSMERAIKRKFGLDVSVIVRTAEEMQSIVSDNPLLQTQGIDAERLQVTFLKDIPQNPDVSYFEAVKDARELLRIHGKEIYLFCPDGYGRTKLSNQAFEKKLGATATTRNWKTVKVLGEMSKGSQS